MPTMMLSCARFLPRRYKARRKTSSTPSHHVQSETSTNLVITKENSSYRSIKKRSDHFFSIKKDPNESFYTYVKTFKAKKAKIIGCDDSTACSAFRKRLSADYPLFGELIIGELSLANSYALAEKSSLLFEMCSHKPLE
ncbi:hypothetical protein ACFX14_007321 [Malus domestica]